MIPIVFPHTYLSSRLMLLLPAVFSRIGVYLPSDLNIPIPMQRWVDSGLVELRVPVSADKQRLAAVLKAFGSWASMQSGQPGIDIDLLKAYHSQKPFFDAPFASQIRTDIHRRMTPASSDKNGKAAEAESLFNARVFLSIAQQLDEQADTLDRDYAAVDQRQQDLMRALHADDPPALSTPGNRGALRAGGQGQYMLAQRLRAWAQLAAADPALTGANAPALFVTGSREVLQGVVEQLPPDAAFDRSSGLRVPLEESDPLRDWRRAFSQALAALTGVRQEPVNLDVELPAPPPVAPGQAVALAEIIRIPRQRITDLLGHHDPSPTADSVKQTAAADTLIIYLGPETEFKL